MPFLGNRSRPSSASRRTVRNYNPTQYRNKGSPRFRHGGNAPAKKLRLVPLIMALLVGVYVFSSGRRGGSQFNSLPGMMEVQNQGETTHANQKEKHHQQQPQVEEQQKQQQKYQRQQQQEEEEQEEERFSGGNEKEDAGNYDPSLRREALQQPDDHNNGGEGGLASQDVASFLNRNPGGDEGGDEDGPNNDDQQYNSEEKMDRNILNSQDVSNFGSPAKVHSEVKKEYKNKRHGDDMNSANVLEGQDGANDFGTDNTFEGDNNEGEDDPDNPFQDGMKNGENNGADVLREIKDADQFGDNIERFQEDEADPMPQDEDVEQQYQEEGQSSYKDFQQPPKANSGSINVENIGGDVLKEIQDTDRFADNIERFQEEEVDPVIPKEYGGDQEEGESDLGDNEYQRIERPQPGMDNDDSADVNGENDNGGDVLAGVIENQGADQFAENIEQFQDEADPFKLEDDEDSGAATDGNTDDETSTVQQEDGDREMDGGGTDENTSDNAEDALTALKPIAQASDDPMIAGDNGGDDAENESQQHDEAGQFDADGKEKEEQNIPTSNDGTADAEQPPDEGRTNDGEDIPSESTLQQHKLPSLRHASNLTIPQRHWTYPSDPSVSVATIAYAVSLVKCGDKQSSPAGLVDAALVMRHSIHLQSFRNPASGSRYDYNMYAIVHRDAVNCSNVLEEAGFTIVVKDPPIQPSEIKGEHLRKNIHKEWCCGHDEFIKLFAYELPGQTPATEPEPIVVHVDIDFAFYKPMDHLYDAILFDKDSAEGQAARAKIHLERPDDKLPERIDAYITRDYPQLWPGRIPGYQAGFLVARRDTTIVPEILDVIREGVYDNGFSKENGWGNAGYGGYVGVSPLKYKMCWDSFTLLFFTHFLFVDRPWRCRGLLPTTMIMSAPILQ